MALSNSVSSVAGIRVIDTTGTDQGLLLEDGAVATREYLQAIAEGDIPSHTPWVKIGFQPASDTAVRAMWNQPSDYVFPTVAMQMEVVSSSASDGVGGTGARTVKIYYLDGAGVEKTTSVTTNGTGVVATSVSDIYRINSFRVTSTGTGNAAAGTITLRHLADTPIYSAIAVGENRARQFIYTVPTGKKLFVTNISFSAGYNTSGKRVTFNTKANYNNLDGAVTTNFFQTYSEIVLIDNAVNIDLKMPTVFPAGIDLKITVEGETNAICTCGARGWLEAA